MIKSAVEGSVSVILDIATHISHKRKSIIPKTIMYLLGEGYKLLLKAFIALLTLVSKHIE